MRGKSCVGLLAGMLTAFAGCGASVSDEELGEIIYEVPADIPGMETPVDIPDMKPEAAR